MARPNHHGSTGHGTGRAMPVPLRVVLQRDRYQKAAKRARRAGYVRLAERGGKRGAAAVERVGLLRSIARALGLA